MDFKIRKRLVAFLIFAAVLFSAAQANAAVVYYESVSAGQISKGLVYEKNQTVTSAGFLDVYVLKVPLDDKYITVSPASSKIEYGLKETTTKLLLDNGAVAGVNGDFFGVAGNYSVPLGLEVVNGKITSASTDENAEKGENATLFIGSSPFIEYVKTSIAFFNGGAENIPVGAVNKTVEGKWPVVLTRDVMSDTKDFDARVPNSVKIVVENGVITFVSQKSESVSLPSSDSGYILLLSSDMADKYLNKVVVGQAASLQIKPSVDLTAVTDAISGAGKLLENGKIANDTGYISAGKAPRTALGLTKDKKTLIMMVVDGRGHSVGASHADMADLMIKYGAYDAMHLDGGGSSTFAVDGGSGLTVLNSPSDGSQRKVINALGVFVNAPVGAVTSIKLTTAARAVVKGQPLAVTVAGYDDYLNEATLDLSKLAFYTFDGSGTFFDGDFYPNRTGNINVYVSYDERLQAGAAIVSEKLAKITAVTKTVQVAVGEAVSLKFSGTGAEGYAVSVPASSLNYEVSPQTLGSVTDGVFTAATLGSGYIRAYYGEGNELAECFIAVKANLTPEVIDTLDGAYPIAFSSAPEQTVTGAAEYFGYDEADPKNIGIALKYSFVKSYETQAAYVNFTDGIPLGSAVKKLRLTVYGNLSMLWLRGHLTDANGAQYTIDFTRNIDFTGWKRLDAVLPENALYPLKLTQIYVVSLTQTDDAAGAIILENLNGLKETDIGSLTLALPKDTSYTDALNVKFYGEPTGEAYDVTIMGSLNEGAAFDGYDYGVRLALSAYSANSSAGLYFGAEELAVNIPSLSKNVSFRPVGLSGIYGISLNTKTGGLFSSDSSQWAQIETAVAACFSPWLIIQTDVSPLNFTDTAEGQLLHELLANSGKQVFVVSNEGAANSVTLKDGVRYINLGSLCVGETLNGDFSVLRFRVSGENIKYAIERVFN
ncbi:hypothetical protein FACS189490_00110 [Clostridia bacterium]|nr:hypothetical protein FACS189490_00110 [Clostridia bacterium]